MSLVRALCLSTLIFCGVHATAAEKNMSDPTAKLLEAVGEKGLAEYNSAPNSEFLAFRFTWSRGFHDPMVFRLILKDGNRKPEITIKKYSTQKKAITLEETHLLTPTQVENLLNFARGADFWNRPEKLDGTMLDGAEWQLEGVSNKEYHMTTRWSPLPPYYPGVMDPATRKVVKKPNLSFEEQAKISDEVGLDMFGMLIMFMYKDFDEEIY